MSNFGCAVNSNLAAMVANPGDLVSGRESTSTRCRARNKAIEAYRAREPKVNQVQAVSSKGN
jgi:pilus assembly protein CpaD